MTILDLEAHRETCKRCTPWSVCAEGARLLEQVTHRAAVHLAPLPKKPGDA